MSQTGRGYVPYVTKIVIDNTVPSWLVYALGSELSFRLLLFNWSRKYFSQFEGLHFTVKISQKNSEPKKSCLLLPSSEGEAKTIRHFFLGVGGGFWIALDHSYHMGYPFGVPQPYEPLDPLYQCWGFEGGLRLCLWPYECHIYLKSPWPKLSFKTTWHHLTPS